MVDRIPPAPPPSFMPRTTAPSTNPRILSGYAPYADHLRSKGSASTAEARRQLLLDDPHARDVQPEQVTCTHCAKTIRLQKGKDYHLAHWLDHRWRCSRVPSDPPRRARCLTLLDRKTVLEADEDAKVVEPNRVVCGRCHREVKLRKGRAYGLSCWNQHKTICQLPAYLSASTGSESASLSIPRPGNEAHNYNPLTSDPLVALIESQYIKCALCLARINIRHPKDIDMHVWRRHRISCITDTFTNDKPGWTRPKFFRSRRLHHFESGSEMIDTLFCNSSDSDNTPPSQRAPSISGTAEKGKDQTCTRKMLPIICAAKIEPSPSPSLSPLSLSYSIPTSTNNSVASTPLPSPQRGLSLFPNSRHLPFPEHRTSRDWAVLERHARDECEIELGALELHFSPLRSVSSTLHRSPQPPPYLERTPLSLPVPYGYWRFEVLTKSHVPSTNQKSCQCK